MNFFSFFFFSPLPLFVHDIEARNDIKEHVQRTLFVLFSSEEGGRVFLYPFTVQHERKKSLSPVTRTIFKEIYKLPDKLCLRVGSFSNFVVQAAIVVPLSTNDVSGSSLIRQLSTDNFLFFHRTCDLFHGDETRGQNLWIQRSR